MPYTLPNDERVYLRRLAKRQAEIAVLPIMQQRRQMWTDMNDNKPCARPPFAIETWTFDRDFMPASIYQCTSEYGRRLENGFLRHIRHHELLNDDHVCPDTIDLGWHVWCNEFGIDIHTEYIKDAEGVTTGYHFECPITDLNEGFEMVKPSTFGVDREDTLAEKQFLEETFGDIMPIAMRSGTYGANCLTQRLMRLMSMETFFMAMYDCPDKLHALMALLRDNAIRMSRWAEQEGLLILNNGNQCTCGTCFNFTTLLPTGDVAPGQVKLSDMWAGMDSQETVGVSPDLFHEFCFPYYRDLAEMFGLVYWGCCEPADPLWETSLSKLPNLKAVSISRWADERFMADALTGTGIVYSRKPNPNLLGVDVQLDEDAWAAEIRTTLEITAGKNIPLEFVVRDVYSMHGNLNKPRRAVEIARGEIDKFYPPLG
ncbi:MAG: uroporphyrinogen decarboxylase/cobalamine-independent methonine synthase family protein [Armatimonadota bacterium]